MANPTGTPETLTAPRFEKGQSGNPGGQPKSRQRLTTAFLNALADDFDAHGKEAIETCRLKKPAIYVKIVASLCPKEVDPTRLLEELNAGDILTAIRSLESYLATRPPEEGVGETRQ